MLINVTQSRLVFGRFTILPGDKVPAFELTEAEAEAVAKFKNRGFLREKEVQKPVPIQTKPRDEKKPFSKPDQKREPKQEASPEKAPEENHGENKGE